MDQRNGLIVNAEMFVANGTAERDAALVMRERIPGGKPMTVSEGESFDRRDFVAERRPMGATPHAVFCLQLLLVWSRLLPEISGIGLVLGTPRIPPSNRPENCDDDAIEPLRSKLGVKHVRISDA